MYFVHSFTASNNLKFRLIQVNKVVVAQVIIPLVWHINLQKVVSDFIYTFNLLKDSTAVCMF